MPKVPRVSSEQVIRALLRARFYRHHQTGSHLHLRHTVEKTLRVVIPRQREHLAPKTLKSLLAQAHIGVEDFINFYESQTKN